MNIYSLEQTHLQYGTQLYDGVAKKTKQNNNIPEGEASKQCSQENNL